MKTRDASGLFLLLDHNAGLLALHIANTAFTFLGFVVLLAHKVLYKVGTNRSSGRGL